MKMTIKFVDWLYLGETKRIVYIGGGLAVHVYGTVYSGFLKN